MYRSVPRDVRLAAFNAAMIGVRRTLDAHGYLLDAIAELELVDERLAEPREPDTNDDELH